MNNDKNFNRLFAGAIIVFVALVATASFWLGKDAATPPVSKTEYRAPAPPAPTCVSPLERDDAANCVEPKIGRPETLSSGYVRVINTDQKLLVYETDYGFLKTFDTWCGPQPPIWVGMRLYQINYRWVKYDPVNDKAGCYTFDYIGHAASGDLEMKMVPKS